jgi:hypothetical protein
MSSKPAETDAERQLRLVRQSILSGVTGCFEWQDAIMRRARENPDFNGIEPHEIKKAAIEYVRNGGRISQRRETDEAWIARRKFDFWYGLSFDIAGLNEPVFLKIVLLNEDDELPESLIVGAHTHRKAEYFQG